MFYLTEAKAQNWRALAVLADGSERLLFVGRSTTQVRGGYAAAYADMLGTDERARVSRISLQCWDGTPDRGRWVVRTALEVPPAGVGAEACLTAREADGKGGHAAGEDPL